MTWIYAGSAVVLAIILFIVWLMRREKKAGRTEAKAEGLAKHAEITGKINEADRTWGDDTRDPETDVEWDEYFSTGHKPKRVSKRDSRR